MPDRPFGQGPNENMPSGSVHPACLCLAYSNSLVFHPFPKKLNGVIPEDLLLCCIGDGLCKKAIQSFIGVWCVGMRVVGIPDDEVIADEIDCGFDGSFVTVAGHEALAAEVVTGFHFQGWGIEEDGLSASFDGMVIETAKPEGKPSGVSFETREAHRGEAFEKAGINNVPHGNHVFEGEAHCMFQGDELAIDLLVPGTGMVMMSH